MAADLHLEWLKPVRLPKEDKFSLTIDTQRIPASAGVYMFFCRYKGVTNVVYVGKAENLKSRAGLHKKNHDIIKTLLGMKGIYYLMPGVFKSKSGQNAKACIATAERVLIRKCIEDEHPLINVAGSRIKTRNLISTLPPGSKFLWPSIPFES